MATASARVLLLDALIARPAIGTRSTEPACFHPGSQNKFVLGASWTAQSKPAELQNALQVREPHLDLLALTS